MRSYDNQLKAMRDESAPQQHTSGPWEVKGALISQVGGIGQTICALAVPTKIGTAYFDNTEANARLIAAAPELLEACKALIAGVAECEVNGKMHGAITMADAAIAKARGDTQFTNAA